MSKGNRFSCTLCGDCCTGSQVVRLTGGDLQLLERRLGLTDARDLRATALVSLVREPVGPGKTVWRPRLRFRTRPLKQCPFLVNEVDGEGAYRGLCSLHPDDKPLVCALSPLTREVEDSGDGAVFETWSFVAPVERCPGVGLGEVLDVASPPSLRSRLAAEVRWMRYLIAESPNFPDENSAWNLLFQAEALT